MNDFAKLFIGTGIILATHAIMEPPKFYQTEDPDWCQDSDLKCPSWAQSGECSKNPAWMMANCKKSCQSCQGGDNAWKLRDQLAAKYDNKSSGQTLRKFLSPTLSLHSLLIDRMKIDETQQNTWNDSRIQWNPEEWNLSWLTFFWTQIWTPQIVQTNSPVGAIVGSTYNAILAANYTGQIYLWLDFVFSTNTNFRYADFPFDKHDVCFNLDNKRYYAIKFVASQNAADEVLTMAQKASPSGWQVVQARVDQRKETVRLMRKWNNDPFDIDKSTVDVCFTFKRDSSYVNIEIIMPSLVPAVVTLASFMFVCFKRQMYMLIASLFMQILAVYPLHELLPPAAGYTPCICKLQYAYCNSSNNNYNNHYYTTFSNIVKFFAFNTGMTCIILLVVILLYGLSMSRQSFLPPPRLITRLTTLVDDYSPFCCSMNGKSDVNDGDQNLTDNDGQPAAVNFESNGGPKAASPAHRTPSKHLWQPAAQACHHFDTYQRALSIDSQNSGVFAKKKFLLTLKITYASRGRTPILTEARLRYYCVEGVVLSCKIRK
uniref:ShKT domain-containing protein n=1 Tax=Romanomermis culicivorax TaxID=13658 RepID=A0A915JYY4_ROMCU